MELGAVCHPPDPHYLFLFLVEETFGSLGLLFLD